MQPGSHIILDFGTEVGGHISFDIDTTSKHPVSLAFSESVDFAGPVSDDTGATPGENWDLALNVTLVEESSRYRTPPPWFRGGFRYLTINAKALVRIRNVQCETGFAPNMPDLTYYSGRLHISGDENEILNQMWYAGAYTIQTNIAPRDTGRFLPQVRPGWAYNATLGIGPGPFVVDGAKRDRAIWPGDLGVQGITAFLAFGSNGLEAVHNSLETLFYYQNASTGMFPFAGPDTNSFLGGSQSDTYHAWSLIGMYDYTMYSGNQEWLDHHWNNITRGLEYILQRLDPDAGLQNQTQPNDWGRQGGGGFNSALNALDYHVLVCFASITTSSYQSRRWLEAAAKLKSSYNALLWDSSANLYRDNTTTTLHPQDGNSLALLYNLTQSSVQAATVSQALTRNWNDIGPVTPELPDTISPFVSGLEVLAHYTTGGVGCSACAERGMELMKRLWGYLLRASQFTDSTFVEGITANGSLYYRSTAGYDYDAAYTSLSHGWSTAPVQVLTKYVLGLDITGPGGKMWRLDPQIEGLSVGTIVQGGFETGLGRFEAKIKVASLHMVDVEISVPSDTVGELSKRWTAEQEGDGMRCDPKARCLMYGGQNRHLVLQRSM